VKTTRLQREEHRQTGVAWCTEQQFESLLDDVAELYPLLRDAARVIAKYCQHEGIGEPGCMTCDPRIGAALGEP
jgi:hypothetical protein